MADELAGAGNTTKLASQIIVICNIQALAKILTLAQREGKRSIIIVSYRHTHCKAPFVLIRPNKHIVFIR